MKISISATIRLSAIPFLLLLLAGMSACDEIAGILPSPSKGFVKFYGGMMDQQGADVKRTADQGYILIGSTHSYGQGGSDLFIVKTDSGGNALWTQTYGGPYNDRGIAIQLLPQGGYVVVGDLGIDPGGDTTKIWILGLDSQGDSLWSLVLHANRKSIEISAALELLPGEDGFMIMGTTTKVDTTKNDWDPATDLRDIYVARVYPPEMPTERPRLAFFQEHGFAHLDEGIGVRPLEDGTYDILGNTIINVGENPQIIFSKISREGIPLISTKFVQTAAEARSMQYDAESGQYLVAGRKLRSASPLFWARLNADGNGDTGTIPSPDSTTGLALTHMIKIPEGYLVAGTVDNSIVNNKDRKQDFFLRAMPNAFDEPMLWESIIGSEDDDYMEKVIPTLRGYAFVGTSGFSNITNLSLIKVNEEGEL